VTVTAATQVEYGLKALKPGLAASLAARFDQRRLQGPRLIGARGDAPLGSSLNLQALDVALERLGEIGHQMMPIRDLPRGGGTLPRAVGIEPAAIAADDLDVALLLALT
jgi:hypothetical protein